MCGIQGSTATYLIHIVAHKRRGVQEPLLEQLIVKHPHDRPEAKEGEDLDEDSLFQLVSSEGQEQTSGDDEAQSEHKGTRITKGHTILQG